MPFNWPPNFVLCYPPGNIGYKSTVSPSLISVSKHASFLFTVIISTEPLGKDKKSNSDLTLILSGTVKVSILLVSLENFSIPPWHLIVILIKAPPYIF